VIRYMYIYDGRSSGSPLCRGDRHTSVPRGFPSRSDSIAVLVAIGNERLLIALGTVFVVAGACWPWLKKMPLSICRRCGHRPSGFQVHVSDHDHADRGVWCCRFCVAATALNRAADAGVT